MRVLCLTFGDHTQGSTFYRIYQYIAPLAAQGIHLEPILARQFDRWQDIPDYDVVLLQKTLLPSGKLRKLRRLSRRLVYDVDDAIWHPHGKRHFFLTNLRQHLRLKTIVRAADLCLAANDVLAAHLRSFSTRVLTLPMALDEQKWKWRDPTPKPGKLRVGWSGHPVNFRYLQEIEPALLEIQKQFAEVEFAVFSGEQPRFQSLKFSHVPFVPGTEPEVLRTFDIGLLPLPDDPFSQGKSPIKGLQYLASGAAVALSPVGAAAEMFTDGATGLFARNQDGWVTALQKLINEGKLRQELARQGRRTLEERFSLAANAPQFAAALTGNQGGGHGGS
jgi:glycosyltransferase involved in cell wall biosynthesis